MHVIVAQSVTAMLFVNALIAFAAYVLKKGGYHTTRAVLALLLLIADTTAAALYKRANEIQPGDHWLQGALITSAALAAIAWLWCLVILIKHVVLRLRRSPRKSGAHKAPPA